MSTPGPAAFPSGPLSPRERAGVREAPPSSVAFRPRAHRGSAPNTRTEVRHA